MTDPLSVNPAPRAPSRPRWLLPAVVAAAVVLVLAAGLGYWLTRPPKGGFGSPEGIAALLAERGAPCENFEPDGDGHAKDRGACYADGKKIIIATFKSRKDVEAHWERQLATASDNETVGMVIGQTWTISGAATSYLQHAAEVLDAEYRSN